MKFQVTLFIFSLLLVFPSSAEFQGANSWIDAKNKLDDLVYFDHRNTFYCGCDYQSHSDDDGSGSINAIACGLGEVERQQRIRDTIQWEHIVPASLMPVGDYMCWQKESEVARCKDDNDRVKVKNRNCCELVSPSGKLMIFDLFNLAPASAQLNQYRSKDPYGEIDLSIEHEGFGKYCSAKDVGGTRPGGLFEPPDCKKGDVARTWFYMRLAHGVEIDNETNEMFLEWSKTDPVSPWEKLRHDRISSIQKNSNPYVEGVVPNDLGS